MKSTKGQSLENHSFSNGKCDLEQKYLESASQTSKRTPESHRQETAPPKNTPRCARERNGRRRGPEAANEATFHHGRSEPTARVPPCWCAQSCTGMHKAERRSCASIYLTVRFAKCRRTHLLQCTSSRRRRTETACRRRRTETACRRRRTETACRSRRTGCRRCNQCSR